MQQLEDKAKEKEKRLNRQVEEMNRKSKDLEVKNASVGEQLALIETKKSEVEKIYQKQVTELSNISGLSVDDAKERLKKTLVDEARTDAMAHIKEISDEAAWQQGEKKQGKRKVSETKDTS